MIETYKPSLISPPRNYVGVIVQHPKTKINVRPSYDHFFISRFYADHISTKIKISWRFNEEGRLDLIDLITIWRGNRERRLNERTNIITVLDYQNRLDKAWEKSSALYHVLPDEINIVNRSFSSKSLEKRYNSLARFGHGIVKDVLRATNNNSLQGLFFIKEGNRSLDEIVKDEEAKYMMINAARVLPIVSFEETDENREFLGEMIISYVGNYATFE